MPTETNLADAVPPAITSEAPPTPPSPGAIVEENILPTPNSMELARSARGDYVLRFDARSPHVAELFQENTKLVRQSPFGPDARDADLARARAWYMATAYRLDVDAIEPGQEHVLRVRSSDLAPPLGRLFSTCGQGGPLAGYLYAVDLMVLHGDRILRVVPDSEYLWVEKRIRPDESELLRSALLRVPAEAVARARAFVFVLGVPWRYMMFLGPRGYRHMMFDAGAVISGVSAFARQLQLTALPCLDFYDVQLDRLLLLDGVERTTLGVIILEGQGL